MPDLYQFLSLAEGISYPFVSGPVPKFGGGCTADFPKRSIASAGFCFGRLSEFSPVVHTVTLYGVERTASLVKFDFRSGAPGMVSRRWLFEFDDAAGFGASVRASSRHLVSDIADDAYGWGFLTVGDISGLAALAVGTYGLCSLPEIEPALLEDMSAICVTSIGLANDGRACGPPCGNPCGSSSSSAVEEVFEEIPTAYRFISGLQGDLRFREGRNSVIRVSQAANSIEFGAGVGRGEGEPCENVLVDRDGFRYDDGECVTCEDFIRTFNGRVIPGGRLRMAGGPGVGVVADAERARITIAGDNRLITGG